MTDPNSSTTDLKDEKGALNIHDARLIPSQVQFLAEVAIGIAQDASLTQLVIDAIVGMPVHPKRWLAIQDEPIEVAGEEAI